MMFSRDEKTKEFNGFAMFDFQVTRYNSPALDVANFMYTSMKLEARLNHREELIKLYLKVLLETLAKLGHPVEISYEVSSENP